MLKILWLPSWYPNKYSPQNGDFVQRHAQAVSLFAEIMVIILVADEQVSEPKELVLKNPKYPNLIEKIVYYPRSNSFFGKFKSYFLWYSLYKKSVKEYLAENGHPDLVHVHVAYKSGLIAKWIKRKYNIPYLVTEHWTGYFNVQKGNYFERSYWYRRTVNSILMKADGLHTVSDNLGRQIGSIVGRFDYKVIFNAVNTDKFNFENRKYVKEKINLIHISTGSPAKNIEGLLNVFKNIYMSDVDSFMFSFIGMSEERNRIFKEQYPFVNFAKMISNEEVADELKQSDYLIIFSNIENSPCVIGEALCCGVPVIATDVGGISELIDRRNGIIVQPRNEKALKESIESLKSGKLIYENKKISEESIEKFSYSTIGTQFLDWYQKILNKIGE